MSPQYSDPKAITEAGEAIYREMYQKDFEQNHAGMFVAVNINTKTASLGKTAAEAIQEAQKADPKGVLYLVRVGFPGAFQLSRYQSASQDSILK
jgi:hypothetical protein